MTHMQPVFKPLLKPHLEDLEKKVAPGLFILTWASMNIDGYLHRFKQVRTAMVLNFIIGCSLQTLWHACWLVMFHGTNPPQAGRPPLLHVAVDGALTLYDTACRDSHGWRSWCAS